MRIDTRYRSSASLLFPSFPPGVKWLIAVTCAVYILQLLFVNTTIAGQTFLGTFHLLPWDVVHRAKIWQLASYMFLHGSITHILFNMLMLWMFGAAVEQTWGTRRFIQYYFICGIGAGVCLVLGNLAIGDAMQSTIGASGAIYGLLIAFGMLFPDQEILLFLLFPVKAKYAVMIFAAIEFFALPQGGPVSHVAHLGGMLVGYIYIKSQFAPRRPRLASPSVSLSGWWREYRMQRAKKKFQVYMKKHGSDKGPWVN
ncbi:MAG TPA: rhomboid family intramembrane serine protease [Bryobacteraceae bacterium]|nr:rhomboid family intramembrane serine protease [Bryobacteraceae bacterium]